MRWRWPPTIARTLGVALDHRGESAPFRQGLVDAVPVGDRGGERRLVHGDDRRLRGGGGELRVESAQLLGLEAAAVLAGDRRVDDDQPQRPEVDCVVDRLVGGAGEGEDLPHRRAVVVVAGQDVERDPEPTDQLGGEPVLRGRRVLGEVPGDDDRVDPVRQPLDRVDHFPQRPLRLHPTDRRLAEVRVTDLGQKEGARQAADPSAAPLRSMGRKPDL